ncbi:metal-sensitive transcriptional regulator [Periweissella ghanensis]|uniref:Copper-sensing transcriptional repressor CsoR n=1 Tax=Periweissella ghanensis TaxID=467997 RepID=A0ABN8BLR3_9LACO|nr:metal-sensitive transcriptional regulator [Periweissella ghanensis]MCM0601104.1 metal-sensitive transcriptional regulator [Periweissella ghanensis]CAH0417813.1 Copper-sensing transcriptional repressor CsoR [Periweissella ghanensis]
MDALNDKKAILNRLKRAEGQIRGIQNMITEEHDCVDIITQLSAVRSSIDRTMGLIMAENLQNCLANPVDDSTEQAAILQKAIDMIVKK